MCGEKGVTEVVDAEMAFVALFGRASCSTHDASVVDQEVQSVVS